MEKVQKNGRGLGAWIEWSDLGFLALLALIWVFFHRHIFFDGRTFVLIDASRLFFPLWDWGAKVWATGRIPLWNPDAGFGTPYLSNPENVCWYPPLRILYFLLTPVEAFNACVVLHHLFAMAGFYFFSRNRKVSKPASFLGAVLFGYSLHVVSSPCTTVLTMVLAWIPWIYAASDRLFDGRRGSFLFLSVSFGFQLAGGYPILAYLTLLTIMAEKVLKRHPPEKWALFLGAVFLGTAYNLAWLIPFADFLRFSTTAQRLDFHEDLPLRVLGTWVNPFFIFHPLHSKTPLLFELSCYFMGWPALVLILWGSLKRKLAWVPALLAALWVVLSLGGPAGRGMEWFVPFYHWVARSGYWMSLVVFAAASLATSVMDQKINGTGDPDGWDGSWLMAGLLVYTLALGGGIPVELPFFWGSLALVIGLGAEKAFSRPVRWLLLAGSIVLSLFPAAQGVNFTNPGGYYEVPPPFCRAMTKPGRIYASFPEVERFEATSGKTVSESYNSLKDALVSNWPLIFGMQECYFYNSFFLRDYFDWCFSSTRFSPQITKKVLDYLNVRYVLGYHSLPGFQNLSPGVSPTNFSENEDTLPKWNSVSRAFLEADFTTDLWKAGDKNFNFDRQCFVGDPRWVGFYSGRKVTELSRDPNHVFLSAPGKGRALLVSSEMAFPGWWLRLKNSERPMGRVNDGFRGAVLEEGEEQAEVIYRPATFRLGCFLSLLVCALWLGMLLNLPRKIRHA